MSDSLLPTVQHVIDRTNQHLAQLVSWFTVLMVILTFVIVVLRYGFNLGWIAMQESVMYLHATVFLMGCANALRLNEHVRVDIFYRKFSTAGQARVDLFGSLLLLLPVNIFITLVSWRYVKESWRLLEASQEAGGLPLVFALKTLILLFCLSMTAQGLAEVIRNGLRLKHNRESV